MTIPPCDPRHWEEVPFERHPEHDTMWSLIMGHDGHPYIGLCLEGQGGGVAQLYRYDTQAGCLQHLADMAAVTGEHPSSGHATQGKIHFGLAHARDGKLYGSTHCTTPPAGDLIFSPLAMWDDPDKGFPGGHLFRYDTLTDEVVDFGIIAPHEGIPYLMLDQSRARLYGITYPSAHLFRTNLLGRDFHDYGRVSAMYPISMIADDAGNLFSSDFTGRLLKLEAAADRVRWFDTRPYVEPWNRTGRCSPITDMCHGPDGLIYGVSYHADHLFRFDPREDTPTIEDLGPGLPEYRGMGLRSLVSDGRCSLYYTVWPRVEDCVLVRYDLASGVREPVARLQLNGRSFRPWRIVCGPDGTLYVACARLVPMSLYLYRTA